LHARTSAAFGFSWMRRLPRSALHLKCLTALVTKVCARVDARLFQCARQQPPRGPDEGVPGAVFLVARLLADQEQRRVNRTFPEDGLGGAPPQRTGLAARRRRAQHRQRTSQRWNARGRLDGRHARASTAT